LNTDLTLTALGLKESHNGERVTTHCLFQNSHNLKRTVRCRRFPNDDKVKEEVLDCLRN